MSAFGGKGEKHLATPAHGKKSARILTSPLISLYNFGAPVGVFAVHHDKFQKYVRELAALISRRFPLSRIRRRRRAYKSCNRFFSATTPSRRGAGLNSAPMVASNCLSLVSTFSGPIRSA